MKPSKSRPYLIDSTEIPKEEIKHLKFNTSSFELTSWPSICCINSYTVRWGNILECYQFWITRDRISIRCSTWVGNRLLTHPPCHSCQLEKSHGAIIYLWRERNTKITVKICSSKYIMFFAEGRSLIISAASCFSYNVHKHKIQ